MLIALFRAVIMYALVIFSLRLMGKRQLGELQPSELVITILVSNIATLPIENLTLPIITGIIPIITLVCLDVLMSVASMKFRGLRRVLSGSPKVIISNGEIDQKLLHELRYTTDDLMESLRSYNIFDISEIQFAVVETTGKISVYQKFENQPVTAEMLSLKGKSSNPPELIVDDGKIVPTALKRLGLDEKWLRMRLKSENTNLSDVFIMTASDEKSVKIIKKQKPQKGF